MAIKEVCTKQKVIKAFETQTLAPTSAATTTGAIIDTRGYDNGIYFVMDDVRAAGETMENTMKIEDGDDASLADAAVIPDAQLVYGTLPTKDETIAEGEALAKEGIFGNKRYVRMSVESTTAASSGASVTGYCIVNPEIAKTPQDSL
jgi:hypothetical protein